MLSTHIMQEVEACCKRVLIVNKGQLVADRDIDFLSNRKEAKIVEVEFAAEFPSELLNEIAGIDNYKSLGENRFSIVSNEDIRKDIFEFAVYKNLIILEMNTQSKNLEDIFHELTV